MIDTQIPGSYFMNALCVRPGVHFDIQDQNETVLLVLRAHPVTQIPWVLSTILMFVLLAVLDMFIPAFIPANYRVFINVMLVVFILNYAWLNFILYYYQVGIVTDRRVIDVDFYSILYRETSEARVGKIEDVTSRTGGYFGSLFNYGNVHVQTAGAEPNIEFNRIPAPSAVAKIINDVHNHI